MSSPCAPPPVVLSRAPRHGFSSVTGMRISSVRVLAALPCVVALSLGGVEPHALRAEEAERAETRSKLQEAKQDPYLEVPAPSSLAGDAMIPTKPLETPTGTYPRPEEVWDRPNAAPSFCFVPRAVSTYYKTGNYLTQDAIDKISTYILDRCGAGTDRMFPTAYLMGMNHSAPAQDLREWLTGNVYYHPENGTRHNTFEAPPPPEGVRLYTTRRNPYEQIVSGCEPRRRPQPCRPMHSPSCPGLMAALHRRRSSPHSAVLGLRRCI